MGNNRTRDRGVESIRLALRLTPEHVVIYHAVEGGKPNATVAKEHGLTKQRVGQIMARARDVLKNASDPSEQLLGQMDRIEAEACAMAGYKNVMQVIEAVQRNTVPNWWPAHVTIALCRRFDLAVPGRAAARVATVLMKLSAQTQVAQTLISEGEQALRDLRGEESERLLAKIKAENEPPIAFVFNELAQGDKT